MRVNKGLLIDVTAREIREVTYGDWKDLRRLLGDRPLGHAGRFQDGSIVLVDGEGMYHPHKGFFMLSSNPTPIAGNGILVGPDRYGPNGEDDGTYDPEMTIEQLGDRVLYLSREDADRWFLAHGREPAVTITKDGKTTVVATYDQLHTPMPRKG